MIPAAAHAALRRKHTACGIALIVKVRVQCDVLPSIGTGGDSSAAAAHRIEQSTVRHPIGICQLRSQLHSKTA